MIGKIRIVCVLIVLILPLLIVAAYNEPAYGTMSDLEAPQIAALPDAAAPEAAQVPTPSAGNPVIEAEELGANDDLRISEETGELDEPDEAPDEAQEEPAEPPEPVYTKFAYITIDDGPSRAITPGILDLLEQEGISATFFVLPHSNVEDLYRRIIDEGHEMGNHTYSHVYSRLYQPNNLDAFKEDVLKAHDWVLENFDYKMTTFRFPGGSMGRRVSIVAPRQEYLTEIGYRYFNWNIESGDARADVPDKSAAALTKNVLVNAQGKERVVILFHDTWDKKSTLEALPAIIAGLREQGFAFDILRNYPLD